MRILPIILSLALAACAQQETASSPAPSAGESEAPIASPSAQPTSPFQQPMSAEKRTACTASGGTIERRGRIGAEVCVHTYADAGKACTDSSQCEGKCVGAMGPETQQTAGSCQKDDHLFGCYAEILGGKPANAICVD